MLRRTLLVAATFAVAPVTLAHAQAVDASAIARWTAAKVVHYRMVGVYEGPTVIAYREPAGQATVTDRVEIELDWNLKTQRDRRRADDRQRRRRGPRPAQHARVVPGADAERALRSR